MPRVTSFRVMCPAIRYAEQSVDFDIENAMCRKHASVERGGTCGKDHQEQCLKVSGLSITGSGLQHCLKLTPIIVSIKSQYAKPLIKDYEEFMRKRHDMPVLGGVIADLRKNIGTLIFNKMEAETLEEGLKSKRKAEELLRPAIRDVKARRSGDYQDIESSLEMLREESNRMRSVKNILDEPDTEPIIVKFEPSPSNIVPINPRFEGCQISPDDDVPVLPDDEGIISDNPDAYQAIIEENTLNALTGVNVNET